MKNLLTIITLFVFTNSFGQNVWTLKECIDYAYEHNLSLKEYELNAKIDQNRLYQSKMDVLPNLNAGVNQNYNYGRTVDPFTNDFVTDRVRSDNYYVNSSVTLFQGFQKLHTIKRNEYNLQSSLVMIDAIKNDMAINITSAYLQVLFEMELVKQAEDQLDLTKDQYLLTKEKVDAGSLAKGQLYEMESMVSMDEYNLIAAKNRLEIALLNLRQMLDIDNETGFEIKVPQDSVSLEPFIYTVNDVYISAIKNQPTIIKTQYDLESAKEGLYIAKSGYYPSISLNGRLGSGYSDARKTLVDVLPDGTEIIGVTASNENVFAPKFRYVYETYDYSSQLENNTFTSVFFSLNVPIFNNFQTQTNVENAKIELERAELKMEIAQNQLFKDIQSAVTDASASLKKYDASLKNLEASQETYRYNKERYELGMVTYVELKDAKNQLYRAKSDYIQSKYEYLLKTKIIKYYMGATIED